MNMTVCLIVPENNPRPVFDIGASFLLKFKPNMIPLILYRHFLILILPHLFLQSDNPDSFSP